MSDGKFINNGEYDFNKLRAFKLSPFFNESINGNDSLENMDLGRVTIKEFLKNIVVTNLFNVPQLLIDALSVSLESLEEQNDEVLYAWCSVMNLPVIQIVKFNNYIIGINCNS